MQLVQKFVEAVVVDDALWPWLVLALPIWLLAYAYRLQKEAKQTSSSSSAVSSSLLGGKYESLKTPFARTDEKQLTICKLDVYPLRGIITAHEIDSLEVGPFGVRFDREISILPTDGKNCKALTAYRWLPASRLRQRLEGSIVTVTTTAPELLQAKGLPVTIQFDLEECPEDAGPLVDFEDPQDYQTRGQQGHQYPAHVSLWFSTAISRDCVVIRAPSTACHIARTSASLEYVKSHVGEAALSIINVGSISHLNEMVKARNPDRSSDIFLDKDLYRANIYIEAESFREDSLQEMRIGPLFIRQVNPTIRCSAVYLNHSTGKFDEGKEPYSTLSTFRSAPVKGICFGVYCSAEVLNTKKEHDDALPSALGYPSYEETAQRNPVNKRAQDGLSYVRISKEDLLNVRVERESHQTRSLIERYGTATGN